MENRFVAVMSYCIMGLQKGVSCIFRYNKKWESLRKRTPFLCKYSPYLL